MNTNMTQLRATMSVIDEIMKPTKGKYRMDTMWSVTFIGNHVTMNTRVEATDEEDAIYEARDLMHDYYGFDVEGWDAEVEMVGG